MKKKILVTGANGQLGSEINAIAQNYSNIEFAFTDVDTLDITNINDINAFIEHMGDVDFVINCAAYTAVDKAEDEVEIAKLINTTSSENLARVCKSHGIKLIHVSTDYVFDGTTHTPYSEIDRTSPNSVYGLTKREGELIVESICPEHIIIRTSWLYSSFGNNFVKTIKRLSSEKESLNVLFDQIGTPTYARDLAKAIMHIVETSNSMSHFPSGIYHYSNEGVCSWYDFAKHIVEISGNNCVICPIRSSEFPQKANRPPYSVLDKHKIKQTFGIDIPYWLDSLKECMALL